MLRELVSLHSQKFIYRKASLRVFFHHAGRFRQKMQAVVIADPKLQILGPLIALGDPLLQLLRIPGRESNLERLGFRRQGRGNSIAVNRIQNRTISSNLGGVHLECSDQSQERRVEFAVRQVRASAHARSSAISIMGSTRCLAELQVTLRDELFRLVEVVCVVVCGPGVLNKY